LVSQAAAATSKSLRLIGDFVLSCNTLECRCVSRLFSLSPHMIPDGSDEKIRHAPENETGGKNRRRIEKNFWVCGNLRLAWPVYRDEIKLLLFLLGFRRLVSRLRDGIELFRKLQLEL